MTRRFLILSAALWLGVLAFFGFELRTVAQQGAERAALQEMQRRLDAELAALQRECAAIAAELQQAEQQLEAVPVPSSAKAGLTPDRRDEIDRWLARVRKLRQVFVDHPDQRVPEMQLLKEEDWLRTAKISALETEEDLRSAAAQIRSQAIGHFVERLGAAMRKYNAAMKSERPASLLALVPFFDGPVDPTMLEGYEIISRTMGTNGPTWGIANKTAIDPDYDTRYQIVGSGMISGSGLVQWMPELLERQRVAATKWRREHPGRISQGIDEILPYFDPPLELDLAQRLRKAERR